MLPKLDYARPRVRESAISSVARILLLAILLLLGTLMVIVGIALVVAASGEADLSVGIWKWLLAIVFLEVALVCAGAVAAPFFGSSTRIRD